MRIETVRIDINAAWLHTHPECKPFDSSEIDLLALVAEEVGAHESDMVIDNSLLQDIKTLEVKEDCYLLWWKELFIGVLYKDYYMDGEDELDFVCREFWDDLITWIPKAGNGTKLKVSKDIDFECEGDMKISIFTKFFTWLMSKGLDKETINDFYNINKYIPKQKVDENE